MVQRVPLVQMDLQGLLVHLVLMVLLEIVEFQDFLAQLGLLDQEELKALKEKEVMLDLLVRRDQLALLDFKDRLDQSEQEVKEEKKVLLVNRELLVLVEGQVTKDIVVSLVFKVFLDLLGLEEKKAHQEKTERTEILELLVLVDPLELMVLWDKWVILDLLAQEVLKEKKESVVHQVSLDQWGPLDLPEKDLDLTWQLCLL